MFFVHDPNQDFYYLGDEEPTSKTYKQYLVESEPKLIGCDVETISLKERIAIGISIAIKPNLVFYFPLFPTPSPVTPWHLLKDTSITKVFHNAIFDLGCLREYDIDTTNIKDTNIMSRLLCYPYAGLLDMSVVHKMEVHDTKQLLQEYNAKTMMELPVTVVARKCMQDSGASLKLYYELNEDINQSYLYVEMQVITILIEMSNKGILIDQEVRQEVEHELQNQADYYYGICQNEGFNPGSPQQVAYILAKKGAYNIFTRLPFTNRRKTALSTDVDILKKMDNPLASVILEYRTYSKLLSTYIKPWANEDRATTRFHMDAITGRPSSTERNMQNIPGKFRKDGSEYPCNCRGILLPDSGIWTDMDFSQVEPRVLAYLSGDREMQYIFSLPRLNPDGTRNEDADIHQHVANFLNISRRLGKTVNLAMTYGATDETIMETAQIRDIRMARRLKEMWMRKFPEAGDYIMAKQEEALRTGRATTVFGRKIRLPTQEEESVDGIKRKAVDYPCQGSAAEILKRGLILCKDLPMALQVHDEILVDGFVPAHRFEPLESIAPFRTPVEVKYLERWE